MLEENYEPTAEEIEALTNPEPEQMIPMELEPDTPEDKHEIKFDENGKIKFQANGGEIEATKEQLIKYAQQGYGAANKIGELKSQLEELQSKQIPEGFEQYKAIDEWAKQNPDMWNNILKGYEQNQNPQSQTTPEFQEALTPLMEKIEAQQAFIEKMMAKEQQEQESAQDAALDAEIKSIRDQYSDLDWDSPDEDGTNLEWKVMKHAADNGITSFKTAFRDYNHDRLMKLAEERGKEAVINERRQRNKLGLLEAAPTHSNDDPSYDPRKASDEDNYAAALASLRLG